MQVWNKAEAALTDALNSTGLKWTINEGAGSLKSGLGDEARPWLFTTPTPSSLLTHLPLATSPHLLALTCLFTPLTADGAFYGPKIDITVYDALR